MKELCAILDEQSPETAEALVLTLSKAATASDNLRSAVACRKRIVINAVRSHGRAAAALYGGEVERLGSAYSESTPAEYDEKRLLAAIDPGQVLSKKEREVLCDVLWWSPQNQLAALTFLERALRIPSRNRGSVVEELAEHVGPRYLAAQNKCVELVVNAPSDFARAQKEELREGRILITYASDRGTADLYKAFMQPIVLGAGPQRWKGIFDERIKRQGNASTLELTLPEFKATFQYQHRHDDDLPQTFERFMDTNRFRAPPPNHRALQFLRTAQWSSIPDWPLRGYAWRLSVWSDIDEWRVSHEPYYIF